MPPLDNQTIEKLTLPTGRDLIGENQRLEKLLGIPHGKETFHLAALVARNTELKILAAKIAPAPHHTIPAFAAPTPAAVAAAIVSPPAQPKITLAKLASLHAAIFGRSETDRLVQNWANFEHGGAKLKAARAEAEQVRRRCGESSPAAAAADRKLAAVSKQISESRGGPDTEKFARLADSFHAHGLMVPGLSRSVCVNPRKSLFTSSASQSLTGRALERAQCDVDAFLRMTGDSIDAVELTASNPVAQAARDFLKQSGRVDGAGNIIIS